jgi:hypothetical protein
MIGYDGLGDRYIQGLVDDLYRSGVNLALADSCGDTLFMTVIRSAPSLTQWLFLHPGGVNVTTTRDDACLPLVSLLTYAPVGRYLELTQRYLELGGVLDNPRQDHVFVMLWTRMGSVLPAPGQAVLREVFKLLLPYVVDFPMRGMHTIDPSAVWLDTLAEFESMSERRVR